MRIRLLTWNLFHGRDFPPDASLFTLRSRLLRITERNATHLQVNRDLTAAFERIVSGAAWDVALFQECPPRWHRSLAAASDAEAHAVLTSRNSLGALRAILARLNPDLVGSDEGGSNLTLVRTRSGAIAERRDLVLRPGPSPERRTMAFTRIELPDRSTLCVANLHASAGLALTALAEQEVLLAAERSVEWAAGAPVILGGDLNVRPAQSNLYEELDARFGLAPPTAPDRLDHLLARGLEIIDPPAPWKPQKREIEERGRAIRLSDHDPVEAVVEVDPARSAGE